MKRKKRFCILLILIAFITCTFSLKADSGWDGSYDSGGSSWGGGTDYDWGSTSNWGSGSNHIEGDVSTLLVVIFISSIIVMMAIAYGLTKSNKNKTGGNMLNNEFTPSLDINKIKAILPDFDENEFRKETYEIYKKIQTAWMNFDFDTLQKHTTNELFNLYRTQLVALQAKKQKNIMKDFVLTNFTITDMEQSDETISLKVRMNIECKDYVVNENDKVMRGSSSRTMIYDYEMTFTKSITGKVEKCPGCGSPLENPQTTTCPYCRTTITSDSTEWVLSKKQMKNQRMR